MQISTKKTVTNDQFQGKICIKSYTCGEQERIVKHGVPAISTGGEFATVFEDFATAQLAVNNLPTAGETLVVEGDTVSTIEFVTNIGEAALGNLEVVLPGTTDDLAALIADILPAAEYTVTYVAASTVIDFVRINAGDITITVPGISISSSATAYVAPENYFEVDDAITYLHISTCVAHCIDAEDLAIELDMSVEDARIEASTRINLWVAEMNMRITAEITALRAADVSDFVSCSEETI